MFLLFNIFINYFSIQSPINVLIDRCVALRLQVTSRRLGEVGGTTAHNSDNHRRLKDTTEMRIITSAPNFAKPLVACSGLLFTFSIFSKFYIIQKFVSKFCRHFSASIYIYRNAILSIYITKSSSF